MPLAGGDMQGGVPEVVGLRRDGTAGVGARVELRDGVVEDEGGGSGVASSSGLLNDLGQF